MKLRGPLPPTPNHPPPPSSRTPASFFLAPSAASRKGFVVAFGASFSHSQAQMFCEKHHGSGMNLRPLSPQAQMFCEKLALMLVPLLGARRTGSDEEYDSATLADVLRREIAAVNVRGSVLL